MLNLGARNLRKMLLPDLKYNPYYIVTPRYVGTSAGVRVLHLLCHLLCARGYRAYIVCIDPHNGPAVSSDLNTPILTAVMIKDHIKQGLAPILIYPEVIQGNPYDANCVVRYVLNTPGFLAGDKVFDQNEMVWAFSNVLRSQCESCEGVLHMPVIDQRVFYEDVGRQRSGSAYYVAKYTDHHGQVEFGIPADSIRITRSKKDSQTPEEMAEIFRSVEVLYVFENTAVATEAVLCGCPVIFMPNPYLDKPLALEELGWDGYAWGASEEEVARARSTVAKAQDNYQRTIEEFENQFVSFIEKTQDKAKSFPPQSFKKLEEVVALAYNDEMLKVALKKHKKIKLRHIFAVLKTIIKLVPLALRNEVKKGVHKVKKAKKN